MAKASWVPDTLPPRARKRLEHFTGHRDGFVRRYKDSPQPLFVLSKGKFLAALARGGAGAAVDLLEEAWDERRKRYDAEQQGDMARLRATGGLEFVHVASEFFDHLDHRVEHGKPKRLEKTTAWDYKRTLTELAEAVGPRKAFNDLGPDDFGRYAVAIAHNAARSYLRKVSYVEAFVRWALQLGRFADNRFIQRLTPGMDPLRAVIGPQLQKPSSEDVRDERAGKEKSFTPAEIGKLWHVASDEERLWIALGLNAAFDNADLMGLTWRVIAAASSYRHAAAENAAGLVIDYRRRKRGRVRRVAPLHYTAACLLADQLLRRGDLCGDDDFVFGGEGSSGLARFSESGPQNLVTRRFTKLMVRAGLREKPKVVNDEQTGRKRVLSAGSGDGRGYRSLRTTFANLAPAGYRDEVEILMGHAHGHVILDSYVESFGFTRLSDLVCAVWDRAFSEPPDEGWRLAHPGEPRGADTPGDEGRPSRPALPRPHRAA